MREISTLDTMPGAPILTSELSPTTSGHRINDQHSIPSQSVDSPRKDSGFAESQGEKAERRRTAFSSRSTSRDCHSPISTASHGTSRHTHSLSRKSTSSHRTPRPSLVHSASSFRRPASVYNKARPAMSIRTGSAASTHSPANDPLTFHHDSCRLFRSPGAITPYYQHSSVVSSTERLTGFNLPSLRQGSHQRRPSLAPTSVNLNASSTDVDLTAPAPPTTIDWTSAATRRREYEKIDKSHRGIRGWWRRIAPRWCPRPQASRTGFYDGDSDVGSVRRYRIDLPDDNNNDDDNGDKDVEKPAASSVEVKETGIRSSQASADRRKGWSSFGFRGR